MTQPIPTYRKPYFQILLLQLLSPLLLGRLALLFYMPGNDDILVCVIIFLLMINLLLLWSISLKAFQNSDKKVSKFLLLFQVALPSLFFKGHVSFWAGIAFLVFMLIRFPS